MSKNEESLSKLIEKYCRDNMGNQQKDWINSDINLITDMGFDSLTLVNLIVDIETEFNIEISGENLNISDLSDLARLKEIILLEIEKNVN